MLAQNKISVKMWIINPVSFKRQHHKWTMTIFLQTSLCVVWNSMSSLQCLFLALKKVLIKVLYSFTVFALWGYFWSAEYSYKVLRWALCVNKSSYIIYVLFDISLVRMCIRKCTAGWSFTNVLVEVVYIFGLTRFLLIVLCSLSLWSIHYWQDIHVIGWTAIELTW